MQNDEEPRCLALGELLVAVVAVGRGLWVRLTRGLTFIPWDGTAFPVGSLCRKQSPMAPVGCYSAHLSCFSLCSLKGAVCGLWASNALN